MMFNKLFLLEPLEPVIDEVPSTEPTTPSRPLTAISVAESPMTSKLQEALSAQFVKTRAMDSSSLESELVNEASCSVSSESGPIIGASCSVESELALSPDVPQCSSTVPPVELIASTSNKQRSKLFF